MGLSLLHELRRYPRAVAAVLLLAAVAGTVAAFRVTTSGLESRRQEVGYARTAAMVDTKRSQAVDARAGGAQISELSNRAVLLADLMTRSPLRQEIADRAGVPPGHLVTRKPMNGREKRLTQPEVTHTTVGEGDRDAYVLHVGVNELVEGPSAIIGIDARAPDAAAAARLADEAVATLRSYVERGASAEGTGSPLSVIGLEPAATGTAVVGPPPALALFAAAMVLALGCTAIVLYGRLRWPRRLAVAA